MQDRLGAVGGVELDGQRHELEYHQDRVAGDPEGDQPRHVEKEASQDDEGKNLRGELGCRDDLHPQVQRAVVHLVLEGVTALVGGDAHRGDRVAVIDIGGEAEPLAGRIVVVSEHVVDLLDAHIGDPRVGKNPGCRLGTGQSRGNGHLFPSLESGGDTELGPEAEGQRHADQQKVNFEVHGRL